MAQRNAPLKKGLTFYLDQGVHYVAAAFRNILATHSVQQSMSRRGNCWDNAVAGNFFKSLKVGAIYGFGMKEKECLKLYLFEYIEH